MNSQINQLGPLAIKHLQAENFIAAEKVILQILRINPNEPNALKIYSFILARQNRLPECIEYLKKAKNILKNDPEIVFNLGKAYFDSSLWVESIQQYKFFLTISQADPLILVDIGSAFKNLQDPHSALESFNQALALDQYCLPALINKSALFIDLKKYSESIQVSDLALQVNPLEPAAWNNRSSAFLKLQNYEESLKASTKALEINPNFVAALVNYGIAFVNLKQKKLAIDAFRRALELEPKNIDNIINLSDTYADLKDYQQALLLYENAAKIDPNFNELKGKELYLRSIMCLWDKRYKEIQGSLANQPRISSFTPFPLLSAVDNPSLHKSVALNYCLNQHPENNILGLIPKWKNPKIKIAYFSADFSNHPVSYLTAELYELHDRNQFEIYGFYLGPVNEDSIHARIKASVDHFIVCENLNDLEIAKLSRDLQIDIAIDLGGYTQDARIGIFSYRAAPIQVSYIGYLGTVGAPYMDYLLSDEVITPQSEFYDRFYSEKLARLKSYQANDRQRSISDIKPTKSSMGIQENGLVFCCMNNNYKITPTIFNVWIRILKVVPNSYLLLYADNEYARLNLRTEWLSQGLAEERLIFGKKLALNDHLARLQVADLFLDTFPYNAGATASDALWAGLPVLTMMGESFASRVAASLLTAIGLPELITHTPEEYEALAIELAMDREKLQSIKEKLWANRLTTPLFDSKSFTQNLEEIYLRMYERYQSGLLPAILY